MVGKRTVWLLLAVACVLGLHLNFFSWLAHSIGQGATTVFYPCLWAASSLGQQLRHVATRTKTYQELVQAHEDLTQRHARILEELVQLRACTAYFDAAKDLINFKQRYQLEHKPLAKVLLVHTGMDEHYALINQGAREGVRKDMLALYKFQIVGRVVDVFGHYSKVMLLTDRRCKVAAYASKTQAPGIVQGTNEPNVCTFQFVSHLFRVCDDDMVISSGQGLVVPEGFALGTIVENRIEGKALHHSITVRPLVDLTDLRFCILIDHSQIPLC